MTTLAAPNDIEVGILDFCLQGRSGPTETLHGTAELAAEAERLGFARYWLTEHHSFIATQSSPEVMLAFIGARTRHIKLGTGGTLLRFYSALKVAQTFRLLESLLPGRVELGIARGGPGGEWDKALLDNGHAGATQTSYVGVNDDVHRRQVDTLLGFLDGVPPADHPYASLRPSPPGSASPDPWFLGSNVESMRLAAAHGAAYSLALFFGKSAHSQGGQIVHEEYVQRFRPSRRLAAPRFNVAISVLCAESQAEAQRLEDELTAAKILPHNVVGDPETCAAAIRDHAHRFGTSSILVGTKHPDVDVRSRHQELLSRALRLAPLRGAGIKRRPTLSRSP